MRIDEAGDLPFVSIIMPMRNEEKYIGRCLDSVLANDYPAERMEIIIADGMSDDASPQVVRRYAEQHPHIRLLDNPKRIIPSALNVGIQAAQGEIVIRMDCHAVYDPDYVRQCVALLEKTGAANVGARACPVGESYVGRAIAAAVSHPFGVGDAHYRVSEKDQWVDTAFNGAWWKKTLEEIGGYDEEWLVNEDYELNWRIRQAGGGVYYSPSVRAKYFVRGSLWHLFRQYCRYGFWKVKTLRAHPTSLRWRQLVPPMFLVGLIASLALAPLYWPVALIIPGLYAAASLVASIHCALTRDPLTMPLLPVVFLILHLGWGLGFFAGVGRFGLPRSVRPQTPRQFNPKSNSSL